MQPEKMSANGFAGELEEKLKEDGYFAFFLGAGCSRSSGIPTGGELVKDYWIPRLKQRYSDGTINSEDWVNYECYVNFSNNPGAYYGEVIETIYKSPSDRDKLIRSLVGGKEPGFGYGILAELITHETFG